MNLDQIGTNRLFDELKAGNPSLPLFRDLLKDYGTANMNFFAGAISGALSLLRKGEASGMQFKHEGKAIDKSSALSVAFTRAIAQRDLMQVCELTKLIAGATDALRKSGSIDFNDTGDDKPVRVHVLSQPTRETVAEITRDSYGSISNTKQTQRDAK